MRGKNTSSGFVKNGTPPVQKPAPPSEISFLNGLEKNQDRIVPCKGIRGHLAQSNISCKWILRTGGLRTHCLMALSAFRKAHSHLLVVNIVFHIHRNPKLWNTDIMGLVVAWEGTDS